MRLHHLLVTVISFFGSTNILLAAAEVEQATSSSLVSRDFLPPDSSVADHGVATQKRSLRLT
ncbi:hypothetical protein PF005_g27661 [Phytophthora fragariae]|uniref:RxLR effector protein n=1 Tax=Phytophthora fragariae TaxID=53985 RepID=A0A6A3DKT0_9STRA|nr:hypothetical protein PF003_g12431 [Phytophthora fragariae]KAE8921033.1 hypothetical protein PF009_g28679 [Phytophthora fragariae]KAE8968146.1 hypothetical protein PF011_g27291 [Phytophthora fragariae]KAE9067883.1 hypothetical protein PF010_g27288 [Phytophthora fragariae]KAE9069054.1 hypothetical protein PF007_g27465 [Phytophthora fragariae]